MGLLRIGAEWACHLDVMRVGAVVRQLAVFCRRDGIGGFALLHPPLQREDDVIASVGVFETGQTELSD